jgi:virginiamycin A acetyltransferase
MLSSAQHHLNSFTTYPLFWNFIFDPQVNNYSEIIPDKKYYGKPKGNTVIGNDVWIGENVIIMSGVRIGDGAIIANNSHVVKNVEPYSLAGGNPAKHIKYRFTKNQIDALLKIQWWNWSDEKINRHLDLLTNANIDEFIRAASA